MQDLSYAWLAERAALQALQVAVLGSRVTEIPTHNLGAIFFLPAFRPITPHIPETASSG